MRTLALPKEVKHRLLTTLREKLVKIGAKVGRIPGRMPILLPWSAIGRSDLGYPGLSAIRQSQTGIRDDGRYN